jgi:hypothetical protein
MNESDGRKLTTHLQLVLMLGIPGAALPLLYVFIGIVLKHRYNFTFYKYI